MTVVCAAGLLAGAIPLSSAENLAAPEYKLKAAFVYNFAKLTRWPSHSFPAVEQPLNIGVVGADPLVDYLEQEAKGRLVGGRVVKVVRISTPVEAARCHVLFFAKSSRDNLSSFLAVIKGRPVLTVSEIERFTQRGGMVGLFRAGESLRFEVNNSNAEAAGLELSSKLLTLAASPSKEKP